MELTKEFVYKSIQESTKQAEALWATQAPNFTPEMRNIVASIMFSMYNTRFFGYEQHHPHFLSVLLVILL